MFNVGDKVYVKENPDKPATVVDVRWSDTNLIHVIFDDPFVYHDRRSPIPGSWFSFATSLELIDRSSDFEVDE